MSHTTHTLARSRLASTSLLKRLLAAPDLVASLRDLPAPAFSGLVRRVGLEDAGELLALASTAQLVEAFDEDLFVNAAPGQRERFDPRRFALWLEVLLEAGDEAAARRVAELSEDFVVHALNSLLLVLDHDALMLRMAEAGDDAYAADKALESALCEEIDGYLLIARQHEGWDAVLRLVLALDRDQRPLLERLLDRAARVGQRYAEDLDALSELLSGEESLAEDVEAEREQRRGARGYVEPRAARAFLKLAAGADAGTGARDPLTQANFRELSAEPLASAAASASGPLGAGLSGWLSAELAERAAPARLASGGGEGPRDVLAAALARLSEQAPETFAQRMEELVYLANVLLAGAPSRAGRFRPAEAAEAALLTVSLGAELALRARRPRSSSRTRACEEDELLAVLEVTGADALFRAASAFLAARAKSTEAGAFVRSRDELGELVRGLARGARRRAARS
jgi:hypothetical protein